MVDNRYEDQTEASQRLRAAEREARVDRLVKAAMIADSVIRTKMRESDSMSMRILAERIVELEDLLSP